MTSKTQPAFWGGLLIGVLSALPFVGALNMCCCLWVIVGGVLTAYLLQDQTPVPIAAGDGAIGGLLAGVIGAVVTTVLGLVLSLMMRDPFEQLAGRRDLPPEAARIIEQLRDMPRIVWVIGPLFAYLILFPIFAMLGGLLGVAIFKKSAPPPPPPGAIEVLPPEPPTSF